MAISVVINTYNAEEHLTRVLEAVKSFDEIVLCDMYSSDNTVKIAESYGCKVVYHKKEPYADPARNFAVGSASNEWVLVVDADEIVTDELREYLYDRLSKGNVPDGIRIPHKNYFMGRFMHASYPNHILRFFRRDRVFYPSEIHSKPVVDGRVEEIPAARRDLAFIHLANPTMEEFISKMNVYTSLEVEKRGGKSFSKLSFYVKPFFRFFKSYILKGGFKDGRPGLIYAMLDAVYKFLTISKIEEPRQRRSI